MYTKFSHKNNGMQINALTAEIAWSLEKTTEKLRKNFKIYFSLIFLQKFYYHALHKVGLFKE
jgi:hypothetical protein